MINKVFSINTTKINNYLWLYFIVVVLCNLVFKLPYLEYSSFWYDEIISVQSASLDFGHIKHVSEWDKNPPFYYYCLSVWIKLFNDSEFCVRLLSVIFSALAGGILFVFSNKHFNKTTAIVVSFLYLSSNILFFYSHEARAYSLAVLLALLSSYLFFELKNKPTAKIWLMLGLINFLLIYTHYITGFVILFQLFFVTFSFNKTSKKSYLYSSLIVLFLVILRFTKKQILLVIAFNTKEYTFWLQKATWYDLIKTLNEFFYNHYLVLPAILLMILGIVYVFCKQIKESKIVALYCLLVSVGSILILFFLGKLTPVFLDRYLLFCVPFLFILIAYTLSFFKFEILTLSLAIGFFAYSAFKIDYKTLKGMDYRSVATFVKLVKANKDLVIVKTKDLKPLFCYYYEKNYLKDKKDGLSEKENIIFVNSWSEVMVDVSKFDRVIVIDTFQDLNPNEADFVSHLSSQKHYHSQSNAYSGVRLSFYR